MGLDYIETYTGRRFRPMDPYFLDVDILDIAQALSNQCRFSGHTAWHYSTAQHSTLVARVLESWGEPTSVQLWGLLHDASEAYLVDLPTPLKHHPAFAAYRVAEQSLMAAICLRFGLQPAEPEAVRRADAAMLAAEVKRLMPGRPEHWGPWKLTEPPASVMISHRDPHEARHEFLSVFRQLGGSNG